MNGPELKEMRLKAGVTQQQAAVVLRASGKWGDDRRVTRTDQTWISEAERENRKARFTDQDTDSLHAYYTLVMLAPEVLRWQLPESRATG